MKLETDFDLIIEKKIDAGGQDTVFITQTHNDAQYGKIELLSDQWSELKNFIEVFMPGYGE